MPAEDPRIAAFARSNRRRNAIAFAVVGVLLVVAGAIVLAILLAQSPEELANERGWRPGGGYQLIVLAGGAILVGLVTIVGAIRVGKGQLADLGPASDLSDIAKGDQK
jgi:O-antigen ligase